MIFDIILKAMTESYEFGALMSAMNDEEELFEPNLNVSDKHLILTFKMTLEIAENDEKFYEALEWTLMIIRSKMKCERDNKAWMQKCNTLLKFHSIASFGY